MAYFKPYIDASGLHVPGYIDIRDDLIAKFKQIYGQDIYLDNDSQDYQLISAFALKTNDAMQLLEVIYNNRSPKTAVGSALDGIVKLNGIKRKAASYSTCVLTLCADIGTTIKNGAAEDESGAKWLLPEVVEITANPQKVTATCRDIGAIEAMPGTITKIATPTKGWISVINDVPAVKGAPIETDEELRLRQSISVANPSQTLIDGTIGGIASVEGVNRYRVYENDTNQTDENGIPGHSIAAIVEGGTDEAVATQVYLRKGIGGGTYGNITIEYTNMDGLINLIRFSRPQYVTIDAEITIKKMAGYTEDTKQQIIGRVKDYLDSLNIGVGVIISSVWAAALSVLPTLTRPIFSVQEVKIRAGDAPYASQDAQIAYNQVSRAGTVTIQVI